MSDNTLRAQAPVLLTVPGIDNSGPNHWQTIWERKRPDCQRVELGAWSRPQRELWAERLKSAIEAAGRPVILVAHSLGCHAVGWWNALGLEGSEKVVGALLVAPPDVEDAPIDKRLRPFGPVPRKRLPFPSLLIGSGNDPYANLGHSRRMARIWGSQLIDAGPMGHINADSGLGDWPYGLFLLRRLIDRITPEAAPLLPNGAFAHMTRQIGHRTALSR